MNGVFSVFVSGPHAFLTASLRKRATATLASVIGQRMSCMTMRLAEFLTNWTSRVKNTTLHAVFRVKTEGH